MVGVLLYHARALNQPTLTSFIESGTNQTNITQHIMDVTTHLLNYSATYPNPTLRFVVILRIFCDESYLSVSRCRSKPTYYFYLSSGMSTDTATSTFKPSITIKKSLLISTHRHLRMQPFTFSIKVFRTSCLPPPRPRLRWYLPTAKNTSPFAKRWSIQASSADYPP